MSNNYFGFVAEPHKGGRYLVSPARLCDGLVTCSDLSGFMGSWLMKDGGVFFPSIDNKPLCRQALANANQYASRISTVIDDR